MKKINIKNLIEQGKLTGKKAGIIMLQDYISTLNGDGKLLSDNDKTEIINSFKDIENIQIYNGYINIIKILHSFDLTAKLYSIEIIHIIRILHIDFILLLLQHSKTIEKKLTPVIMTEKEYNNKCKNTSFDNKDEYPVGIAIIKNPSPDQIDKNGHYTETTYTKLYSEIASLQEECKEDEIDIARQLYNKISDFYMYYDIILTITDLVKTEYKIIKSGEKELKRNINFYNTIIVKNQEIVFNTYQYKIKINSLKSSPEKIGNFKKYIKSLSQSEYRDLSENQILVQYYKITGESAENKKERIEKLLKDVFEKNKP